MIVYGAFHSSCVYESAQALVSLHATKAGAWRAKHALMWEEEVRARDFNLAHGHMGKGWKPLDDQSFAVRPVEVLP